MAQLILFSFQLLNAQNKIILNEGDELAIRLPGDKQFSSYQVDLMGEILLSTMGKIKIAGLTTQQAANKITRQLPLYLIKISSTEVYLLQKRKAVRVWGHVNSPGWKIVPYDATIEEILNAAKGSINGTLLNKILVHRIENGQEKIYTADLSRFKKEGDISILPEVQNQDVVIVLQAEEMDFDNGIRIYGAVDKPGLYQLIEEGNIYDLLVSAGGLSEDADFNKVYINRPSARGIRKIHIPLKKAINDGLFSKLPILKPGDTIYVYTKSSRWRSIVGYFRDFALIASSVIIITRFYP